MVCMKYQCAGFGTGAQGQLTWAVWCQRDDDGDDDGTEQPVLMPLCRGWKTLPLWKSAVPRSVLPDAVGNACASLQPCVCILTHTYMEQNIHVGLYVCMYIVTYILSVCVWVCVRELFKSKTCTKKIWLNLSLRSEA